MTISHQTRVCVCVCVFCAKTAIEHFGCVTLTASNSNNDFDETIHSHTTTVVVL